jgi:hypothetical protein
VSNSRRAEAFPFEQRTAGKDYGIGWCYSCLVDYHADVQRGKPEPWEPRFAITYAPCAMPGPSGGLFVLPLPSCDHHLVPNPGALGNGAGSGLLLPR